MLRRHWAMFSEAHVCCAQAEWRCMGHVALPINDNKLEKAWSTIFQENIDALSELAAEGEGRVGRIVLKAPGLQ